jgi:hypothetical protein
VKLPKYGVTPLRASSNQSRKKKCMAKIWNEIILGVFKPETREKVY